MVVSYIGQWKIPFAGRKAMPGPGGLIIRRPFWLRCTVRPSIPVRNEAQTPPGTAVSQAPATESLIRPPERTASRCPDLASYLSITPPVIPPPARRAAETYRTGPAGSPEMSLTSRPDARIALARCFPVPVSRRSKLRFEPIHTESAGPAVMAGPGPGTAGEV